MVRFPRVQQIVDQLGQLTVSEQEELYRELRPWVSGIKVQVEQQMGLQEIRDARFSQGLHCVRCGSLAIKRNGRFQDEQGNLRQRYLCKTCGRTFNDLTGTPLAYSKKQGLWGQAATCMVEGQSIRKTAQHLGIDKWTAFRWRHKFLAPRHHFSQPDLSGVVEADESYFHQSYKGMRCLEERLGRQPRKRGEPAHKRGLSKEQVCIVAARDRQQQTVAKLAGLGQPTGREVQGVLQPRVTHATTICTDGTKVYRRLCHKAKLPLVAVNSGKRLQGSIYHVNSINAYHSRLQGGIVDSQ